MSLETKKTAFIILSFVWVGFVCAISFMESWVKFTVDSLDLKTGVSVGRAVFGALNKVECVFVVLWAYLFLSMRKSWWVLIPVLMVVAQTFYLLPRLSDRVDLIVQGITPKESRLHFVYVVLEVVKVPFLFFMGLKKIK